MRAFQSSEKILKFQAKKSIEINSNAHPNLKVRETELIPQNEVLALFSAICDLFLVITSKIFDSDTIASRILTR